MKAALLRYILVSLLAGAILSIGLAWGAALLLRDDIPMGRWPTSFVRILTAGGDSEVCIATIQTLDATPFARLCCFSTFTTRPGAANIPWASRSPLPMVVLTRFSTGFERTCVVAGWPSDALWGAYDDASWSGSTLPPRFDRALSMGRFISTKRAVHGALPVGILWTGLIANTLIAAACVLAVWLGIDAIRRSLRKRHGQCRTCGYALTGLAGGRCPECGASVGPVTPIPDDSGTRL